MSASLVSPHLGGAGRETAHKIACFSCWFSYCKIDAILARLVSLPCRRLAQFGQAIISREAWSKSVNRRYSAKIAQFPGGIPGQFPDPTVGKIVRGILLLPG